MPLKPVSARALTAGYAAALLIIAGLSIASHLALGYSLQSNEGTAAIINKSGRQRMLSQRIAGLAAQYRLGDPSARGDLSAAIDQFEAGHNFLLAANATARLDDSTAAELHAVYFGSEDSLDPRVRRYVADARRIIDLPPGDPAIDAPLSRVLTEARTPILSALETIVRIEQRESEQRLIRLEHLQWAILAVVLATLLVEAMVIFRPMIRRIIVYTAELLRLATTDPLTGAANRRSFMERCEAEIHRARRYDRPVSLLMIDVDHFKAVNDTYGHAAGDVVLAAVGEALRQSVRQIDIWGRLGGEEFAVLLVETGLPGAAIVAERIRARFEGMEVSVGGAAIRFTVSIGCTTVTADTAGLEAALRVADQRMYEAKQSGRNRVVIDAPVAA
jgi:diguanylate cyclase (GGDEF)-like protein